MIPHAYCIIIFYHLFIVAIGDRENYLVFSRGYSINKIPYVQSDDNIGETLIYKSGKFHTTFLSIS